MCTFVITTITLIVAGGSIYEIFQVSLSKLKVTVLVLAENVSQVASSVSGEELDLWEQSSFWCWSLRDAAVREGICRRRR